LNTVLLSLLAFLVLAAHDDGAFFFAFLLDSAARLVASSDDKLATALSELCELFVELRDLLVAFVERLLKRGALLAELIEVLRLFGEISLQPRDLRLEGLHLRGVRGPRRSDRAVAATARLPPLRHAARR
jgi:hypothetical protein